MRRLPNSDSFSQHMHPAMPSPYRRPGLPQSYPLAPGDTFSELIASTPVRDDNQGPHGRSKMEESKRRGRSGNNLEVPQKGRDSSDGSDAGSFKGGRNLQDHSVQMSPLKMQSKGVQNTLHSSNSSSAVSRDSSIESRDNSVESRDHVDYIQTADIPPNRAIHLTGQKITVSMVVHHPPTPPRLLS